MEKQMNFGNKMDHYENRRDMWCFVTLCVLLTALLWEEKMWIALGKEFRTTVLSGGSACRQLGISATQMPLAQNKFNATMTYWGPLHKPSPHPTLRAMEIRYYLTIATTAKTYKVHKN